MNDYTYLNDIDSPIKYESKDDVLYYTMSFLLDAAIKNKEKAVESSVSLNKALFGYGGKLMQIDGRLAYRIENLYGKDLEKIAATIPSSIFVDVAAVNMELAAYYFQEHGQIHKASVIDDTIFVKKGELILHKMYPFGKHDAGRHPVHPEKREVEEISINNASFIKEITIFLK
jgi:hypothetical protein